MRFLTYLDSIAADKLPLQWYIRIQDRLRPLLRAGLTSKGRRVEQIDDTLRLSWSNGDIFHFAHPLRYSRYMAEGGLQAIFRTLLNKYQDGVVQIEPGDTVVDVGANVGEFSFAVSDIAGRVISIEPDPAVLASLEKNLCAFPHVHTVPKAAGKHGGEIEFFLQTKTADSSVIEPETWSHKISVKVHPLAEILAANGVDYVDFLKVEAEGYEPEVLEGAFAILDCVRKIAIDCGPERYGLPTYTECEAILSNYGFETWRRDGHQKMLFGVNRKLK